MLIGISGSQGQGKSTVCASLNEIGVQTIPNKTSRSILSDWGYTLNEINSYQPLTQKFQEEILTRHIAYNIDATKSSNVFVSERTFADIFAYALFVLGPFNKYDNWLNSYFERCMEAQKMYSAVTFLTGRNYIPQEDGVRSINRHYSAAVDVLINRTLLDFSKIKGAAPLYTIDTPEHQARIVRYENIIRTLGDKNVEEDGNE